MTRAISVPAETAGFLRHLDVAVVMTLGIAACTACVAYTNNIWEDYFITFRHSQNLAEHGQLVYTLGQRVHGFTSPLNVLLPAFFHWITGADTYQTSLTCFRCLSAAVFVSAGIVIIVALRQVGLPLWLRILFALLFSLEAKSVLFSTNGMETAFVLFFLALSLFYSIQTKPRAWLGLGIGWAGLMWSRPDGCVYIAALSAATLVFCPMARKSHAVALFKAGAVCALLYLPWFVSAWTYYGSPIPNTVLAKWEPMKGELSEGWRGGYSLVTQSTRTFLPPYASFGGWPAWSRAGSRLLGLLLMAYWLLPTRDRLGRTSSLVFALHVVYFSVMRFCYPWYYPAAAVFGLVALVSLAGRAFAGIRSSSNGGHLCRAANAGVAALLVILIADRACLAGLTAYQLRLQQREIEFGVRMQIGKWLREHMRTGERVYLEPLGYIGYFSGAEMVDFPGLVSPQVVTLRKEQHLAFEEVVPVLKPEWVVVRPWRHKRLHRLEAFRTAYTLACTFDATERIGAVRFLPGRTYLELDASFAVFRRNDGLRELPADGGLSPGPHSYWLPFVRTSGHAVE